MPFHMKPSHLQPPMRPVSPVTLSENIYRHLLILYPPRFRHEYGREMALVFRSQCRHRLEREGEAALALLWFSTLGDLFSSALAERMKEGFSMSKVLWVQLSGIVAVIGGLLGLYLAALGTSTNEYGNYGWDHPLMAQEGAAVGHFDQIGRDRFIVGNPDECIATIRRRTATRFWGRWIPALRPSPR